MLTRFKKRFLDMPISQKFVSIFAVMTLFSCALMVAALHIGLSVFEEKLYEKSLQELDFFVQRVDDDLQQMGVLTRRIAVDTTIQSQLAQLTAADPEPGDDRRCTGQHPGSFVLLPPQSIGIELSLRPPDFDLRQRRERRGIVRLFQLKQLQALHGARGNGKHLRRGGFGQLQNLAAAVIKCHGGLRPIAVVREVRTQRQPQLVHRDRTAKLDGQRGADHRV